MVYLGTEYYDFRIVFVFSSIFGINYECGYSLCVEKCSGMVKSCVEKCIFAAVLCVEKCNCHGENSAKTACGMEE